MPTLTKKLITALPLKKMTLVGCVFLMPAVNVAEEDSFFLEPLAEQNPSDSTNNVLAQAEREVEIGLGSVDDDAFKFGKYNGLESDGLFAVFNIDIRERGPYDGNSAAYWRLEGGDLGLTSRWLEYEQGVQGDYKLILEYDQLPVMRSDTAQTIFNGVGEAQLSLPLTWVPGTNTAGMTQLLPSLQDVDIEHERRRIGIGFGKHVKDLWNFNTRYRYETKEGLKTVGAVIGNSGGNPRAVLIPEPIDYVTQQLDLSLDYADTRKQFQLGYYLSLFYDENTSLTWQNPYAAIGGWDASAGYPTGEGQLHLPPDNQFHQVFAFGGYNLSNRTRVMGDIALGRMTQDEHFLPYTVNPTLAASITEPLPRESLDGRIDTLLMNLRLSGRPTAKLRWNAGLRRDERDNKTPRNEYVYIGGDSQTQNTATDSNRRRFNEPYSYTQDQLRVDTAYKFIKRSEVSAGYEHNETERAYSEREQQAENIFRFGLKSTLSSSLNAGVRLLRADRHGSTYIGEETFLSGYAPGYTSTVPGEWENHPDLRKFYLADRIREQAILFATYLPVEKMMLSLNANYSQDDYDKSEMGLIESQNKAYTLDASYEVSATLMTHAFYSNEKFSSDQDGRQFNALPPGKLVQAADPDRDWFVAHLDRIDTVGIGGKKILLNKQVDLGADYLLSESNADIDVSTGSALTSEPLPTLNTRLESISIYMKYQLKNDLSVKARYFVERFKSSNWALDNVDPNTLANVITLGESSPDYKVHVVTLSLSHRF